MGKKIRTGREPEKRKLKERERSATGKTGNDRNVPDQDLRIEKEKRKEKKKKDHTGIDINTRNIIRRAAVKNVIAHVREISHTNVMGHVHGQDQHLLALVTWIVFLTQRSLLKSMMTGKLY